MDTFLLGIDLAQLSGWSKLRVWDEPLKIKIGGESLPFDPYPWCKEIEGEFLGEVVDSGELDLGHGKDKLYGPNNLPVGEAQSLWLNHCYQQLEWLITEQAAKGLTAVIVEVPDSFMMGYNRNSNGGVRKASDPRTIQSMLRLSAMVFAVYGSLKDEGVLPDWCSLVCVGPNDWQKGMLHNLPANAAIESYDKVTKALSVTGAWYHLGLATDNDHVSDASLMALWWWINEKQLERVGVQTEFTPKRGKMVMA